MSGAGAYRRIALVFREIDPWTSPVSGGTFDSNPNAPDRKCRVIVGPVPRFPCSLKSLCEGRNGRNVLNSFRSLKTVCSQFAWCIFIFFQRLAGLASCEGRLVRGARNDTIAANQAFRARILRF